MSTVHRGRLHFVLATDLAPAARPHLTHAVQLAAAMDAHATLFHAAVPPTALAVPAGLPTPLPFVDHAGDARRALLALANSFEVPHPVHVAVEIAATATPAILAAAERLHADLLVLPTHGRTGLRRALLGSTAEQVLRRSTCPVLLLTDAMLAAGPRAFARGPILLAVDASATGAEVVAAGADLARRLGLPLRLFSAVPERDGPPAGAGAPVAAASDAKARLRQRLSDLRRLAASIGGDLDIDVFAEIADDPAAAILRAATASEAAFVAIATHGRRGAARLLRGSVAERVVRASTVPVLCTRLVDG